METLVSRAVVRALGPGVFPRIPVEDQRVSLQMIDLNHLFRSISVRVLLEWTEENF